MAGWPTKVRRRDGTLVPFDVTRIEAAVARAAREVAYDDPDMPVIVAREVADALGRRAAPVEVIQDFVEARLGEAGLDDVARAYIIYRQRRAELRAAKALLGVRDELKLSLAAVTVLRERYLLRDDQGRPVESTGEMMDRAANCVAAAEDEYRSGSSAQWAERFSGLLRGLQFLPNSPTLMNAGTDLGLLAGCFVLPVEDSLRSIFTTLGHAAEIQRTGGGTGYAFSHLRPAGDRVASTGGTASGPMSFLRLYDTAASVISMGGRRRGACMAVLDSSHPDIYDFVTTKAESPSELTHFNLSVGVTDTFLRAVARNGTHCLVNPRTGKTVGRVRAVELFDAICEAAHTCGDPGLVFLDTINRANPLPGRGRIEATNPCGEVPLLPYESCNLGSINLARMITADGHVDWDRLADVAGVAVRFLDDVIDVSRYPFPELGEATRAGRKIGLGIMGLAEMLASLGIAYDSDEGVRLAGRVMRCVQRAAHAASARLAEDRGPFPAFADSRFARSGPRRNAQVTSVAPTGTISLIAGTTAGIEPMFAISFTRAIVGRHLLEVNPCFDRLARDRGLYSDELIAEIAQRGGVRGYPQLPAAVRAAFPIAAEIPPTWAPADAGRRAAPRRRRRVQDGQPARGRDGRRYPRHLLGRMEGKGQGHHGVSLRQPGRPGDVLRRARTGAGPGRYGVQRRMRRAYMRVLTGNSPARADTKRALTRRPLGACAAAGGAVTFGPRVGCDPWRSNTCMRHRTELPPVIDLDVTTHGELPGAADYARRKIGDLGRLTHRPVLHARVKLTRHGDPAVERPVVAQANIDVQGRLVRAQVEGATAREAIDRLEARLRRRLHRAAEHWESRRGELPVSIPHEWRHQSEPTHRPNYFPRPTAERRIVRRKSFTLAACTVDEAVLELDLLDYEFHLFTEKGTGMASVIYRAGPTGYRLAQVAPAPPDQLSPFELPVTISAQPVPCLTLEEATERLGLLGLPFLFFIDAAQGRASVLYHRYDGHYGLITPAG